jgi:transposase
VSCWRRLRGRTEAGAWPTLHELLRAAGELDLDCCAVDSSHGRALKGGTGSALARRPRSSRLQAPPDLRRRRHPARRHPHRLQPQRRHPADPAGRRRAADPRKARTPRRRPRELFADGGYDHDKYRHQLRACGITPRIARRSVAHGSCLGRQRWVVERGFAWLHAFKRLRTRYEHHADIHLDLLRLACALICYRHLPSF